ncbi:acetate uptake transporter [Poriferisphaera corsica]|nr:GPR1/FUN34/YaaH family transporter [Poriferisphaera corsica]
MSDSVKVGNPAVVGLAGFGLTTLLLQVHNLGLCSIGPVLAMGLIFGGLAQMIAGFQEQKIGNNFGFSAFVAYGSFWIGLGIIWILNSLGIYESSKTDVGWFLVAWTGYTTILWIASMWIHKAMFSTFTLLIAGFILLDLGHFGPAIFNTIACYVLILCALNAWYMMAGIIINDLAGRTVLPMGTPVISAGPAPASSQPATPDMVPANA